MNQRPRSSASSLARARWAEHLAAQWYRRNGFRIVAMNWSSRVGELDVVAARGSLLVVCEVKARANEDYGSPLDAVTPAKQRRVRRTAMAFLDAHGLHGVTLRFDVAAVLGTRLDVLTDAF